MNLLDLLRRSTEKFATRTALIAGDRSVTYEELWEDVRRLGTGLRRIGVEPGERVGLMLPNIPEFVQAYFGILAARGTVVPLNVLYKGEEVRYILEDAAVRRIITSRMFLPVIQAAREKLSRSLQVILLDGENGEVDSGIISGAQLIREVGEPAVPDPQAVAVCLYTSGTTGRPKGALLSHQNLLSNIAAFRQMAPCDQQDRFLCVLPLFHSFAATVLMLFPLDLGAGIVLEPRFSPDHAFRVIAEQKVTIFAGVPAMYALWVQMPPLSVPLSAVRFAVSGGAPLPVEVLRRFEERYGILIYEGYGLTEAAPVLTENPLLGPRRVGSVGKPLPGIELKIVDGAGREVAVGEVGEIIARGPNIMQGYLNQPEATAEVLRDGWLYTGDLGRRDAEGYLYVVDRKKDLMIVGGLNVYPREVEEVILAHEAVADAAVVGIPDATRGEVPKAFVMLRPGATATEAAILKHCRERLASFKVPRQVEICTELPRTFSGKVMRRALAARVTGEDARGKSASTEGTRARGGSGSQTA
ncbi:MAG: long-chain fatty acid--CoA ligase [Candidatus Methylomirabilales bacterium]